MSNSIRKVARALYRYVPLKKEIFSTVKRYYSPRESIYKHLHFIGDFRVAVSHDHSFMLRHYGYELENSLFWTGLDGQWESLALKLWALLAQDAPVIMDVGANTGIYSLLAKSVNPEAKVIAFEPIKRVFEKLLINNDLNNFDIECLMLAVSDEDGTATIYDFPGEHSYSSTFHKEIFNNEELLPISIEVARLDKLIESRRFESVDLMKIDVEGHEPSVLEGMGMYLSLFRPTILIEILTDEIGDGVAQILSDHDYYFFYIDENEREVRRANRLVRETNYNYLVCSPGVANKLGLGE